MYIFIEVTQINQKLKMSKQLIFWKSLCYQTPPTDPFPFLSFFFQNFYEIIYCSNMYTPGIIFPRCIFFDLKRFRLKLKAQWYKRTNLEAMQDFLSTNLLYY